MSRPQVLLIPDLTRWVTGTIALRIAAYNTWMDASVISQPLVRRASDRDSGFLNRFDLIHFVSPDFTRAFPPESFSSVPTVTSIHHVLDWDDVKHNAKGDAVMTVAERYRRAVLDNGIPEEKVVTIANVVDLETFREYSPAERTECRRDFRLREDDFIVGFVGKQTSDSRGRKGIDLFVEAVNKAAQYVSRIHPLIIGPGWGSLVAGFRERGIAVTWKPFLADASDVSRAYGAMSCYAVTSRVEGGPVPLLEAMATGTPAVSTPVGIAPETIEHEHNGLLVDEYNGRALADAIRRLAEDDALRRSLASRCRETIERKHNATHEMRKVVGLYRTAWNRHHAASHSHEPFTTAAGDPSSETTIGPDAFRRFLKCPPLGAATKGWRHWIRGEEQLVWARSLSQSGNRLAAYRSLAGRLVTEPQAETLTALCRMASRRLRNR